MKNAQPSNGLGITPAGGESGLPLRQSSQTIEHPSKCPLCRQHWLFDTNYLGELIARHPPGKCISPAAVYEKEDPKSIAGERRCLECKKVFSPRKGRGNAEICGYKCRKARNRRAAREWYEKQKRAA